MKVFLKEEEFGWSEREEDLDRLGIGRRREKSGFLEEIDF